MQLAEIWSLLRNHLKHSRLCIWDVIVKIHGALLAIGLSLLVLFFLWGMIRTCTSWQDVKRPEQAFKLFLRFIIARGLVMYGMDLMTGIFDIVQGIISSITRTVGIGSADTTMIPQEIIDAVNNTGFLESIPLWAVTLLGSVFITILSFIMILTVYGRFFKIYMYTAISPIPLSQRWWVKPSTASPFWKAYARCLPWRANHSLGWSSLCICCISPAVNHCISSFQLWTYRRTCIIVVWLEQSKWQTIVKEMWIITFFWMLQYIHPESEAM